MEEVVIESGHLEEQYWRDLWKYRQLFYFLAWRDFLVRYKQTVLGIAWALVRPLLTMWVFTVVFGRIAKLPSEGTAPYSLLVFAGMLPWQFFSNSLAEASNSLVLNPNLLFELRGHDGMRPIYLKLARIVPFLVYWWGLFCGCKCWRVALSVTCRIP